MPIIKSAIKRVKQDKVRQKRNYSTRRDYKEAMKEVVDTVKDKKEAEAQKALQKAYKTIDTAAKKNVLNKKNAAHKKSRLAKLVATLDVKKDK